MDKKKINVKDFLINNGIIMLLVIMVAYVSITKDNFFSFNNMKGIALNLSLIHISNRASA